MVEHDMVTNFLTKQRKKNGKMKNVNVKLNK